MATYMIGYDLNKAGQDYSALIDEIKALANGWWHHLDSTWIVNTNLTAVQVRDRLRAQIDANDELLVAAISEPAAWYGFTQKGSDWLKANL